MNCVSAVPYFTVEPEIVNAAEGETVTFSCEASGEPEPIIQWVHNGKPIEQAPNNPRRSKTKNSVTITNVRREDTGNYGCNATNSLGYVYKDVYVNVLGKSYCKMKNPHILTFEFKMLQNLVDFFVHHMEYQILSKREAEAERFHKLKLRNFGFKM